MRTTAKPTTAYDSTDELPRDAPTVSYTGIQLPAAPKAYIDKR